MLNWNQVLKYIKNSLALPSSFIEKTDLEMKEWIVENTIPLFSEFFPDDEYTSVVTRNINYKVPGRPNYYRFFDEEDLDIVGIKECFFSMSGDIMSGHPYMAPMSFESMKWWALDVFKSRFFEPFSAWNKSYKFISPNMIQIMPAMDYDENFVVWYEREQPHDLRKIPTAMKRTFKDLALADIMVWIGRIRSHYGDGRLNTPFGEIPLNGSELLSSGESMKDRIVDQLRDASVPPIVVDVG